MPSGMCQPSVQFDCSDHRPRPQILCPLSAVALHSHRIFPLPPFTVPQSASLSVLPLKFWRSSGLMILCPFLILLGLPKQSHSCTCIFKDHWPTDSSEILSSAQTSLELWNCTLNCLCGSSTWMSHGYLIPNRFKTMLACFSSNVLDLSKWYLHWPRWLSKKC